MSTLIELKNVTVNGKRRPRLTDINLSINDGERIALIGKSGSGKTTLISVTNGLIKPNEGEAYWKGEEISELSQRKRSRIGTLWQDLRLIEELNVCQNINSGALNRKSILWAILNLIGLPEIDDCIKCLIAVGLPKEVIFSNINELSGGQKQRVAIARLLRQNPELILADEPFSSLDPQLIKNTLSILIGSNEHKKDEAVNPTSVLISLHRPELIYTFDRVIGLDSGKLVLDKHIKDIDLEKINLFYTK
ncbi:ATP-binding cassette domain-containing protein [Prochlorococcus sp. MIT 1341]|uniref:ATP-binding cassette domain-containing protein n=1 Tax=Prochlorococcus sp. MIT 1341 TaxID=3096221 RepID=UPI002A7558AC|nr:ATP-binding cassette domain-containing protein [Prochlorococcus sp. MIT 1341]